LRGAVSGELSAITSEFANVVSKLTLKERIGVRAGYAEKSVGEQWMNGRRLGKGREFRIAVGKVLYLCATEDSPAVTQLRFKVWDGRLNYVWIHAFCGSADGLVDEVVYRLLLEYPG
jgi:hypothetical protein